MGICKVFVPIYIGVFYPSIKEALLQKAIQWAKDGSNISEIDPIGLSLPGICNKTLLESD